MLLIIVIAACVLIGIGLMILGAHMNNTWTGADVNLTGKTILYISSIIMTIVLLTLIGRQARFNAIVEEYTYTKAIVEKYEGYELGNMAPVAEKVLSLNTTIAEHKSRYKSPWCNLWHSQEVGDLSPLLLWNNCE